MAGEIGLLDVINGTGRVRCVVRCEMRDLVRDVGARRLFADIKCGTVGCTVERSEVAMLEGELDPGVHSVESVDYAVVGVLDACCVAVGIAVWAACLACCCCEMMW